MLHGKPPVSARYMIEPRCLIRGDGSTVSFPGDFAELGKWLRPPNRPSRRTPGTKEAATGIATGLLSMVRDYEGRVDGLKS